MYNEIIIHHSGAQSHFNLSIDDFYVSVLNAHLNRGFSDIGYHYLISGDGSIEAGRLLSKNGAHCYGHNDTIGVCFAGNYVNSHLSSIQIDTFVNLLSALICGRYLTSIFNISAHKYYRNTLCPGNCYYDIYLKLKSDSHFTLSLYDDPNKCLLRYVSEVH